MNSPSGSSCPETPPPQRNPAIRKGNHRTWISLWGPVAVMMGVIFSASTDLGRMENSSRLIGPIVRFFFPDIGDAPFAAVVFAVRKCGHLTEYAILAGLLWRALGKPVRNDLRPGQWRTAALAVALAGIYAVTDEVHQSFNPHRMGQWQDVVLDIFGASAGVATIWFVRKCRKPR
jgi:VanZ family protein